MERGSISIDALISMVLIISLASWLYSMVTSEQSSVNSYGAGLQTEYLAMEYGSIINNYYATRASSPLVLEGPVVRLFEREIVATPFATKSGKRLSINMFSQPTYPVPEAVKDSDVIITLKKIS